MGIIQFKEENGEVLELVDVKETITNDVLDSLKERFDKRTVSKLEMDFVDGILMEQIHDLGEITPEMVNEITITMKKHEKANKKT